MANFWVARKAAVRRNRVDFDFYGHQYVAHLAPDECGHRQSSAVDGHDVLVRHFGAIVPMDKWQLMADKLVERKTEFVIEPYVRFKGEVGEQATDVLPGSVGQCDRNKVVRQPRFAVRKVRRAMKTLHLRAGVIAGALLLAAGTAAAQTDTLKKIKDSGAVTLGVRDASGAMSSTLGPGNTPASTWTSRESASSQTSRRP